LILMGSILMKSPALSLLLVFAADTTLSFCSVQGANTNTAFTYVPYRFESGEQWWLEGSGDPGATRLEGRTFHYDFTKGAEAIILRPPDRVLLGMPEKLRLRARGAAKGHPLAMQLRTHFMTFEKAVGEFNGEGEQSLEIEAPPGHGWKWFGGENDGKLHGPLRLGEIRLEAGGRKDAGSLELVAIEVEGTCPQDHLCLLTASTRNEGEATRFVAEVRAASGRQLAGTLHWTIRDWEGAELAKGSREVAVPESCVPATFEVPAPVFPKGLKFAEAEFSLEIPGQVVPKVQAYWLAPLTPHSDTALRPESPFGMGVYLGRFRGEDQERVARMARNIGVKWSREGFSWGRIERQPGQFDWSFYDRLVEVARTNGITIYGLVSGFAPWSKGYTSEGVDQYTTFLRQLVTRYKDRVKQWEVWNEPNIFFWQGPKELYAECLIKSYKAIKETDPAAEVLGISTAGIDYKFIERMLAKRTPFDVLTIHPYRTTMDDAAFIADLKKVSNLVKTPEGKRRPVWLTEMGWATHVPHHALRQDFQPNSQRAQAEYLARTYLCSIVSGVEPRSFWYDFRNDGDDPVYFEHNMGIVTRDLRPKPAALAFATMTHLLKGMRFAGPAGFEVPDGVFAFRFEPDPKAAGTGRADYSEVLALWRPKQDASMKVPLKGRSAEFVNTIGETQRIVSSEEKLDLTLQAGKVVYIASQRTVGGRSVTLSVDLERPLHRMAGGIGASWHAIRVEFQPESNAKYEYRVRAQCPQGSAVGANPPLDWKAWKDIDRLGEWLGLDWLRVEMDRRMYEPGRGEFTWDSEEMRTLYRILDWCQANGADVFLTEMWRDVDWLAYPGVHPLMSAPNSLEDFAEGLAALADHLLRTKHYSCVKWLCIANEPPGGSWGYWWSRGADEAPFSPTFKAVRQALDRRGIALPLSGPDWTDLPKLDPAKLEFAPYLGAYDIHSYGAPSDRVSHILGDWAQWAHQQDKPFFLTELGDMSLGWGNTNPGPRSFEAVLSVAEKVLRGLNAGVDGFNRWSFLNRGDQDGQWQLVRTWDLEHKRYLASPSRCLSMAMPCLPGLRPKTPRCFRARFSSRMRGISRRARSWRLCAVQKAI